MVEIPYASLEWNVCRDEFTKPAGCINIRRSNATTYGLKYNWG
jgi:hypothetical protein